MKYALALPYVIVFFTALLLSLPFVIFSLGLALAGDNEGSERLIDYSPAGRMFLWMEQRNG